jgi:hypothetical protein
MLPRGAGFSETKTVELFVSHLEQNINSRCEGEVKAVLSKSIGGASRGSYEDALVACDAVFGSIPTGQTIDISVTEVVLKGQAAVVGYTIRCALAAEGHALEVGRIGRGSLRLSKHRGSWQISECDHLLTFLCTEAGLIDCFGTESWMEAATVHKHLTR